MVKAIVTRQNPDGTFDEVGMNSRYITGTYVSVDSLLRRHKLPNWWKGSEVRYEFYFGESISGVPFRTVYSSKAKGNKK